MGTGSDGKIYYVLSSENIDQGAKMFCFDPKTQQIKEVGDVTEACGEKGNKAIPQGKSHVNFVEKDRQALFRHPRRGVRYVDGKETMGIPPAGYKPYPGGHLLSYDLKTGKFEDYGICPEREGVLTMNMDTRRGRLFALTWPSGIFYRYDLATRNQKSFGKMCAEGENGTGPAYRTVCRSIVVDPQDEVPPTSPPPRAPSSATMPRARERDGKGETMVKDYFGSYDPTDAGHMGYNWRQTFWREQDNLIYGVHGNSGYLFRFDPPRAAPRSHAAHRTRTLQAQRHVRPVQLWLPGLCPRPRRQDHPLPHRRSHLH